jgi:hypothetical protein
MASAWGTSWGTAWGDSWATGTPPTPPAAVASTGGGGGRYRGKKLPRYYSRRLEGFEHVELPQEEKSNEVALGVLADLAAVTESLNARERDFAAMLADVQHAERLTALYIESQQIYLLIEQTKKRIQAAKDAEIAEHFERMELEELMGLL